MDRDLPEYLPVHIAFCHHLQGIPVRSIHCIGIGEGILFRLACVFLFRDIFIISFNLHLLYEMCVWIAHRMGDGHVQGPAVKVIFHNHVLRGMSLHAQGGKYDDSKQGYGE